MDVADGFFSKAEPIDGIRICGSVMYSIPYALMGRIVADATMTAGLGVTVASPPVDTVGS